MKGADLLNLKKQEGYFKASGQNTDVVALKAGIHVSIGANKFSIESDDVCGFNLEKINDGSEALILTCQRPGGEKRKAILGKVTDKENAQNWIEEVNGLFS